MAKDDGRPRCRTCGALVGPGAGQEVSRWLENVARHFASNPRGAAQAAAIRAQNQRKAGK